MHRIGQQMPGQHHAFCNGIYTFKLRSPCCPKPFLNHVLSKMWGWPSCDRHGSLSLGQPGVISSYILQILVVHLRDIEGRLQKLVSIVANLVNVYGPVQQAAKTDWAVFRLMHWASLLQRAHPQDVWESAHENELIAEKDAALTLVSDVSQAVQSEVRSGESQPLIFVTAAWGWMSEQLRGVLRRWRVMSKTSPLLVLCRDRLAADACETLSDLRGGPVRCVMAPRRLGVEAIVAKYLVPRLEMAMGDPWQIYLGLLI